MRSDPYLKRLYNQYNKKYFGNQLPKIKVHYASPAQFVKRKLGKTTCAATLYDENHKPVAIVIKKFKRKAYGYIKSDLLHEMVHVALPFRVDHGPRFQAEMLRLAMAGAFEKVW
jgi:hypothetical protein